MDREILVKRIADLTSTVEKSLANHNALIGRLQESREFLEWLDNSAKKVEESVEDVEKVVDVVQEVV